MDSYEEIKKLIQEKKLMPEQKITLCYNDEFGILTSCKTRFYHCEIVPLYKNCPKEQYVLKIYHLPAGKRNMRITSIMYSRNLVIFNGYKDINDDELNYIKTQDDGLKIFESKYTAFNDKVFQDLIEKYPDYMLCKV